uniref:SpoOB alpha-helical domain-containing protein n=1 Tax=Ammonifex degensii TaxID=42838 RepID=A0A7C2I2P3_9THEO
MEPREVLELLRAQYHDFLNCLQVISGLVDLGRPEKIKEYIRQAADEFAARGRVAKAGLPEIACLLLQFQAEAVADGIKVSPDLQRASEDTVPETAFLQHFHRAAVAQASESGEERRLTITGRSVPEGYALTYSGPFAWEKVKEAVAETAAASGVRIEVSGEEKIMVFLPVKDNE